MSFFSKVLPFGAGSLFKKSPFTGQVQTLFRKAPMVVNRGISFSNDALKSLDSPIVGAVARGLGAEGSVNEAKKTLNSVSNILERAKPMIDKTAKYI